LDELLDKFERGVGDIQPTVVKVRCARPAAFHEDLYFAGVAPCRLQATS
jgi:hypothetical protein